MSNGINGILDANSGGVQRRLKMKKINVDNSFFEFMSGLGDIIMVNVMFLIGCVPVVTVGASVFAMYETFREMEEETFISVFRSFKKAFVSSVKKSIPIWLLCFFAGLLFVFDLLYIPSLGDGLLWHIAAMVTGGLMLLWLLIMCWLFPAGLFREGGIKASIGKGLFFAARSLPYTVGMLLLNLIPVVCLFASDYITALVAPPYLALGFGLTAFVNVKLMKKCGESLTKSDKKI